MGTENGSVLLPVPTPLPSSRAAVLLCSLLSQKHSTRLFGVVGLHPEHQPWSG